MAESRRRQIIKHADPVPDQAPEEAARLEDSGPYFDEPKVSFLEKRIYLTWPMITLGMVAVMLTSFLATFIIVKWPEGSLEIPENPTLRALREDLAEQTLPVREAALNRPQGVNAPQADLSVAGGVERTASILAVTVTERPFGKTGALKAAPPVAELSLASYREATADPALSRETDIPAPRQAAAPIQSAKAGNPLTEITPGNFRVAFENPAIALPSQKLLQRRFANVSDAPQSIDGLNPLQVAATGAGLSERTLQISAPSKAGNPVAEVTPASLTQVFDLKANEVPASKLMKRRFANLAGKPLPPEGTNPLTIPVIGQGLPQRTVSLRQVNSPDRPVANLMPDPAVLSASTDSAVLPNQKLMQKRYANAAADPLPDEVLNPLEIPAVGAGLGERKAPLSKALGIAEPVATLDLASASVREPDERVDVPGERQSARRYAKAATNPEKLEAAIQPPVVIPPTGSDIIIQPSISGEDGKPWRRYAAAVPANIEGKAKIVIIIDDMGNSPVMAKRLSDLPGVLNFAFLPYAPGLAGQTRMVRDKGHELLVHLPMEPSGGETPGPKALMTTFDQKTLDETIDWNLSQFEGFVGVNNHMGSRFTEDEERMREVMKKLKERGLLFLDSLTSPQSKGRKLAKAYDMPWAGRDIFLDNVAEEGAILAQLKKAENIASTRGVAIAIGHPNTATYKALRDWIPTLEGRGFVLVPLSSVVHFDGTTTRAAVGGGQ